MKNLIAEQSDKKRDSRSGKKTKVLKDKFGYEYNETKYDIRGSTIMTHVGDKFIDNE